MQKSSYSQEKIGVWEGPLAGEDVSVVNSTVRVISTIYTSFISTLDNKLESREVSTMEGDPEGIASFLGEGCLGEVWQC